MGYEDSKKCFTVRANPRPDRPSIAPNALTASALGVLALLAMTADVVAARAEMLSNSESDPAPILSIRARAEKGDSDAQYLLGFLYATGEGLPRDTDRARKWLMEAAEKGDPRAQNFLGLLVDPTWSAPDRGLKSDTPSAPRDTPRKAAEDAAAWYRRAAAQGFTAAQHNLEVLKSKKLIAADAPPQLLLTRASLASKAPGDTRKDSKAIFKETAGGVVEIVGDGNYGSGVLVGTYELSGTTQKLVSPGFEQGVAFQFLSRRDQATRALPGRHLVVATNAHVLQGVSSLKVGLGSNADGETQAQVEPIAACLSERKGLDLALLFVPLTPGTRALSQSYKILKIYDAPARPERGAIVYALGNPERLVRTLTQGLYNGLRDEGIQFDAPISHGSSGGALLDEKGDVLGITTGFSASQDSQNLNFAVPYTDLRATLLGADVQCYLP